MKIARLSLIMFASMLTILSLFYSEVFAAIKAPELVVSEWVNKDPGSLKNMQGKVVVIDFFQMWCPGCSSFAIPLMFHLEDKYKERDDIVFLSVHTVFEGHAYQTPDDLKEFIEENGIKHPVGIDDYQEDYTTPITMRRYQTGGTPCITIIDKGGYIRFKKLGGFNKVVAERLIEQLLAQQ